MAKKYDRLVYIGRFAPIHNGHLRVIERALAEANRVSILVGSAFRPRTPRNPLTYYERETMIVNAVAERLGGEVKRLDITPVADHLYSEDAWVEDVQHAVDAHQRHSPFQGRVGLIGHEKDGTSYYLRKFPQWGDHVDVPGVVHNGSSLASTTIRNALYNYASARTNHVRAITHPGHPLGLVTPSSVLTELADLFVKEGLIEVALEARECEAYQAAWATAPYPPTFVTADPVVTQSGHVLVVRRGQRPGKGLWALPGGFFDKRQDQNLEDTMVRELREETGIDVSSSAIRRHVVARRQFDDVHRDPRGAFFTTAFHVKLVDRTGLPRLAAGSDAANARWLPLSEVKSELFYADHYDIIKFFTS